MRSAEGVTRLLQLRDLNAIDDRRPHIRRVEQDGASETLRVGARSRRRDDPFA